MLAKTRELTEKVLKWYEAFEFNRIFHAINEFCNADLSALYLDVLKDRMYTFAPTSKERLSAQTALCKITDALVRLVAPILSYTADEVWSYMPKLEGRPESVHLAEFPKPDELSPAESSHEYNLTLLLDLRIEALKALETARKQKEIGKASEAVVTISTFGVGHELLKRYQHLLPELFNVSRVEVESKNASAASKPSDPQVKVFPSSDAKCERCWRHVPDVGPYGPWPAVCGRCAGALDEMGYSELNASVAQ